MRFIDNEFFSSFASCEKYKYYLPTRPKDTAGMIKMHELPMPGVKSEA